jgi:hypothetical protein
LVEQNIERTLSHSARAVSSEHASTKNECWFGSSRNECFEGQDEAKGYSDVDGCWCVDTGYVAKMHLSLFSSQPRIV